MLVKEKLFLVYRDKKTIILKEDNLGFTKENIYYLCNVGQLSILDSVRSVLIKRRWSSFLLEECYFGSVGYFHEIVAVLSREAVTLETRCSILDLISKISYLANATVTIILRKQTM